MNLDDFEKLSLKDKKIIRSGLSELGKAACDYTDMGWSIFPLIAKTKIPAIEGSFKEATDDWEFACWWWSEHPNDNIGIATGAMSGGLLVIDVDQNEDEGKYGEDSLFEWEHANGKLPETVCATSGSGGTHYFYRTPTSIKCSTNGTLCIDRRGDGGYTVAPPSVHPNGRKYEWDFAPDEYEVAFADNHVLELIAYCDAGDPTSPSSGEGGEGRYEFPDVVHDGEGRERHLVTLAFSLRAQGLDFNDIYNTLLEVNNERVIPPKSDKDIRRITKSVCRKPAGLSPEYAAAKERAEKRKAHEAEMTARQYDEYQAKAKAASIVEEEILPPVDPEDFVLGKSGINHALVGEDLIKRFHFCFLGGTPVTWVGDRYESGWKAVKRQLSLYKYTIRESERKEVICWLENNAPSKKQAPWNYIAFKNGVLDIKTMDFTPRSPKYLIPNVIPHNWNPDAQSDLLDETLSVIASGEEDTLANIHEMIGLSMYRGTFISKAFFIISYSGHNGKSTFIKLLRNVLGEEENVSSLDPIHMGERFQSTVMMGKLANFADDISKDFVNATSLSILKRVITGDTIPYEIKGGISSNFNPYCTCIFTMNRMPPLGDGTGGMMRRIHPVSFHHHFGDDDPNTDIHRAEKFESEEVCEAAIVKGIHALVKVVERGDVTHTQFSEEKLRDIRISNNQVLQFIDEEGLTAEFLNTQETKQVYENYKSWAYEQGLQNLLSSVRFRDEVKDILGLKVERTRSGNGLFRYKYVKK